jgi:hypothetical protein
MRLMQAHGLYRGVLVNALRAGPNSAIQFLAYAKYCEYLLQY